MDENCDDIELYRQSATVFNERNASTAQMTAMVSQRSASIARARETAKPIVKQCLLDAHRYKYGPQSFFKPPKWSEEVDADVELLLNQMEAATTNESLRSYSGNSFTKIDDQIK